jgi:AcrR family transcriptional regulator
MTRVMYIAAMNPSPARRTSPRRSHAERSEATQRHLIDSAIDVVRSRSYHGATVFEVAKAAGVTPGALQHHFGSKAVLMMRVIHEILRASDASGVPWPSPDLPPEERARRLVKALWQRVYEPPRFLAAWSVYFGANTDEQVRAYIAAQRAGLAATLRERFAATFPEMGVGAAAATLADLVLSTLRGIGIARLLDPAPEATAAQLRALAELIALRCRSAEPSTRKRSKKP